MGRTVWILAIVAMVCAGCGEIEWFPETEKSSTSPNGFSFSSATKIDVNPGDPATSNAVTVSGIESGSAKISVSGDASSEYQINSAAFTNISGTVKNNETVTVRHTASSDFLKSVSTTLAIGNKSATFTSTTAKVKKLTFADKTGQLPNLAVSSDAQKVEGVTGGIFTIAVSGGNSSKYAILDSFPFGIDCSSIADSLFTSAQGTVGVGKFVCLRHVTAIAANTPITTTLTIDTVQSTFTSRTSP